MLNRNLIVLALAAAIHLPRASHAQPAVPSVPNEIAVAADHKLLFKFEAKGVQIYKAVEGKSGKLEWTLEAPLAELFNDKGVTSRLPLRQPSFLGGIGRKQGRQDR